MTLSFQTEEDADFYLLTKGNQMPVIRDNVPPPPYRY